MGSVTGEIPSDDKSWGKMGISEVIKKKDRKEISQPSQCKKAS